MGITEDLEFRFKQARAKMQTKLSPKLDMLAVAKLVLAAGFTGEDAVTFVAVLGAESGYKVRARNAARDGTEDFGLAQVNEIHKPTETQKYDPLENLKLARKIWFDRHKRGKDGFTAWVAYKNGKHLAFIDQARQAVAIALEYDA